MTDPLTGADVEELEYLIDITQSKGWRVVKNILNKHRIFCIEQAHKHLKKYEDRKAGEWLAKSEEPNTLISLIQNRKTELSKRREKE